MLGITIGFPLALIFIFGVEYMVDSLSDEEDESKSNLSRGVSAFSPPSIPYLDEDDEITLHPLHPLFLFFASFDLNLAYRYPF